MLLADCANEADLVSLIDTLQHYNYAAAIRATETIYGVKPDLTREGGSIPVAITFSEIVSC